MRKQKEMEKLKYKENVMSLWNPVMDVTVESSLKDGAHLLRSTESPVSPTRGDKAMFKLISANMQQCL